MKLKSIKKILDRIDPEIYPLWLENTLDKANPNLYFSIDWDKGTTSLHRFNFISHPFWWRESPQLREYWLRIDDITTSESQHLLTQKYWITIRLPSNKPSKFTKFWYFRKQDGRTCIAYLIDGIIMVYAGCFVGTISEFESAANERYHNNEDQNYAKHILWLRELELKYK